MREYGVFRKTKEERRVQDFRIWYNDVETREMLEILFLHVEETEMTLQKFLLADSVLKGRKIAKAQFKKIRKKIRVEESSGADSFFEALEMKQEEKLVTILRDIFYSKPFREAMFHGTEILKTQLSQQQLTYMEKTLYYMDLYQRVNSDIAL